MGRIGRGMKPRQWFSIARNRQSMNLICLAVKTFGCIKKIDFLFGNPAKSQILTRNIILLMGLLNMRKSDRLKLQHWAITYAKSPNPNPSSKPSQALAIKIHNLMADGEWRTVKAIASELNASIYAVRTVLWCIKDIWNYETSKSKTNGGYQRSRL